MAPAGGKAEDAYRTIGEVSRDTGVPQHVLRYWESRFAQLRPVTRAGGRRYYRPEDVALVRRIRSLLDERGHTIRGVQMLLGADGPEAAAPIAATPSPATVDSEAVRRVRDALAAALADD